MARMSHIFEENPFTWALILQIQTILGFKATVNLLKHMRLLALHMKILS